MEDQNLALIGNITRSAMDVVADDYEGYSVCGGVLILHLEDEEGDIEVVTATNPNDYFYRAGLLREVEAGSTLESHQEED